MAITTFDQFKRNYKKHANLAKKNGFLYIVSDEDINQVDKTEDMVLVDMEFYKRIQNETDEYFGVIVEYLREKKGKDLIMGVYFWDNLVNDLGEEPESAELFFEDPYTYEIKGSQEISMEVSSDELIDEFEHLSALIQLDNECIQINDDMVLIDALSFESLYISKMYFENNDFEVQASYLEFDKKDGYKPIEYLDYSEWRKNIVIEKKYDRIRNGFYYILKDQTNGDQYIVR